MFNYSILCGVAGTRRWNLKPIHQHLSVTGNFYQPSLNCGGKTWFVLMDLLVTSWYTGTGVSPCSPNLRLVIKLVIGIGRRVAQRWFSDVQDHSTAQHIGVHPKLLLLCFVFSPTTMTNIFWVPHGQATRNSMVAFYFFYNKQSELEFMIDDIPNNFFAFVAGACCR